jgi:predicted ATPase/DNA-binding XRE family transcriptional regulator
MYTAHTQPRRMTRKPNLNPPPSFNTFGDLLKYLRRRARLTQRELGIAVGYSEAHISRIEKNQRALDSATIAALFLPALGLTSDSELARRLFELALRGRGQEIMNAEPTGIPSNLPMQLTSFIGRELEEREIAERLRGPARNRLLTLSGTGGIGKTRLAVQAGFQLLEHYPDGVWFLDFAPLRSPDLLARTAADSLGVTAAHGQPALEALLGHLRSRTCLLIFDNCEHLVRASAELAERILRSCAGVQILATSREPLQIGGESVLRVAPLSVPASDSLESTGIAQHAAVRLFLERAKTADPGFALNDVNASAIARICRRIDGLPLAIELAAARTGMLSIEQLEERLLPHFNLLRGGDSTLPRHQTLRATIEWSYDLLTPAEKLLFRRLSVFSGGWDLEACEHVCGDAGGNVLDSLTELTNKSLVLIERRPGLPPRFRLLETIYEYACEQLTISAEQGEMEARHFAYFAELVAHARTFGPEKPRWLDRLEAEIDNLRACFRRTLEMASEAGKPSPGMLEKATEMAGTLVEYFYFRGHTAELLDWLRKLLAFDAPPSAGQALGFHRAGFLTRALGDFDGALDLLRNAFEIAQQVDDIETQARALMDSGTALRELGRREEAITSYARSLGLFERIGNDRGVMEVHYLLGETYQHEETLENSQAAWERGLDLARERGDETFISWGLEGLAGVAFLQGRHARAENLHRQSLELKWKMLDKGGIAYSLEGLAQAAASRAQPERAAILWGAGYELREFTHLPRVPSLQHIFASLIPLVQDQLGEQGFSAAFQHGRSLPLAQAVRIALHD